ncbi:RepA [Eleusine indica associated virus]|uniref:RepA n=1 Tax=Eleusine indica associated virus TaxID=2596881 RepID=A0A516F3J9_9GEMI|nr:RepA [Eleusine indica associated virus]QDO73335.1 RepA [Eleusine indica associated virus]
MSGPLAVHSISEAPTSSSPIHTAPFHRRKQVNFSGVRHVLTILFILLFLLSSTRIILLISTVFSKLISLLKLGILVFLTFRVITLTSSLHALQIKLESISLRIQSLSMRGEYLSPGGDLSMVQKAFPFDWATKLQHFEYSAERLFPTTEAPFIPPHPVTTPDLHCYETIETWMTENIYQVHPYVYMVHSPHVVTIEQAVNDLYWMHNTSREMLQKGLLDQGASTSSVQQGPVRQHGPGA